MPLIQVQIDPVGDAFIAELARVERRSKREQLAYSAIAHAKSLLPNFHPMSVGLSIPEKTLTKDLRAILAKRKVKKGGLPA